MNDDDVKAKTEAVKVLSPRGRVALGCCAVEHILDLYKLGRLKYRAADVHGTHLHAAPDADVVELGLQHAWRFVTEGEDDGAVRQALIAFFQNPPGGERTNDLDEIAFGPVQALESTLRAANVKEASAAGLALTRATVAVNRLNNLGLADDDVVSDEYADWERSWQVRVARRLVALGDQPIARATFDDALSDAPPWRKLLGNYAKRCQASG